MATTALASDVQENFDAYHDLALHEPVRVTKNGQETVFIVSARAFHALKQSQRDVVAAADLDDSELALIEAAEIPEEHRFTLRRTVSLRDRLRPIQAAFAALPDSGLKADKAFFDALSGDD